MRYFYLLIASLIWISCSRNSTADSGVSPDWLIGKWIRLNEDDGKDTYETWEKVDDKHYSGFSYTMELGDTISYELMDLQRTTANWVLSVRLIDDKIPTNFQVTSIKSDEFICENEENDFPKVIRYWMDGRMMRADISNDEYAISFEFGKLN